MTPPGLKESSTGALALKARSTAPCKGGVKIGGREVIKRAPTERDIAFRVDLKGGSTEV